MLAKFLLASSLGARVALAAFGVTNSGGQFTVDAGSTNSLVYKVNQANCDITSILFRGVQYQSTAKYSHIGSGLGTASVSATTVSSTYVKITCTTSTLTHYYVTKSGDATIYMATYITAQPDIGELRYIARLLRSPLPNGIPESYTDLGGTTVEGSDVFEDGSGKTYSKFYSSKQFIDDKVHSVSGSDVVISMVMPGTAYETSAGGPWFRDINSDRGADVHALYWYMNSGHAMTESKRVGLCGPYAMVFSRSGTPSGDLDTSFFADLGISGYVSASSRGKVSGTASGVDSSYRRVVHWFNNNAQYWAEGNGNGAFTSPPMKSGSYTMVLYRHEFEVARQTVSVTAGQTTQSSITSSLNWGNPTWTIGEFDGRPTGFQNADLQEHMHPSDTRMSSWNPKTYTVGSSLSGFPMAQIKGVNDATTITFSLSSSQTGAATLRIGTTLAFAGGRPQVKVNSWSGPAPAAPVDLDSRGFTRGTYRGVNAVYTVSIPSGVLVSGTNNIYINTISGSSGEGFLAPNFIYDAVALWTAGGSSGGTTTTGTTTTTKLGSTTTTTTSIPTSTGLAQPYAQCGGEGYTGPTQCVSGWTCVVSNQWYSQCLQP